MRDRHTTVLRQIYLYWQWLFGTPEKLLVHGFMLSLAPCESLGHGGLNLCWLSSWLSYKSGRREYSFFYSAGPILPTELLCILLCRFWWVVVHFWVRGLDSCCLWTCFLGNSVTCMFYPFGLKHRLDPRALSWCNIRERSSLCLPSARCEPCVLE